MAHSWSVSCCRYLAFFVAQLTHWPCYSSHHSNSGLGSLPISVPLCDAPRGWFGYAPILYRAADRTWHLDLPHCRSSPWSTSRQSTANLKGLGMKEIVAISFWLSSRFSWRVCPFLFLFWNKFCRWSLSRRHTAKGEAKRRPYFRESFESDVCPPRRFSR